MKKIKLEYISGKKKYLNYWDIFGEDVCCEIVDGKLLLMQYDEQGEEIQSKEISIAEFFEMVETTMNKEL